MSDIKLNQYSRKQYGIKQYGKYKDDSVTPGPGDKHPSYKFKAVRIKGVKNKEASDWVFQHTPVYFAGQAFNIRIKGKNNEFTYAKKTSIKGKYPAVRIRYNKEVFVAQKI